MDVQRPEDIAGPTLIYQGYTRAGHSTDDSRPRFFAICLNPNLSRMELADVTPHSSEDLATLSSASKDQAEMLEGATLVEVNETSNGHQDTSMIGPQEVHQVLVAARVLDTQDPPRYTFRTTEHRFLGADKHGAIGNTAEARGPQEEWAVEAVGANTVDTTASSGSFNGGELALRNHVHNTYLSLDEVAGGKLVLRADASHVAAGERWRVKVQWKFRHEARQAQRAKDLGRVGGSARMSLAGQAVSASSGRLDEATLNKSRQGYALGQVKMYDSGDPRADRKALKRAQRDGRAAEELLDRRVKMKSDKFA